MILAVSIVASLLAFLPLWMFRNNVPLFIVASSDQPADPGERASVSVLIPARDEASSIGASVGAALANQEVDLEVVVLDDHSTDATAEIVQNLAESDPRVRLLTSEPLPDGWNGKQFACRQLADAASHDHLVFLDADVRLSEMALANLLDRKQRTAVALLSAFPHQQTGTWLEKWIIPLMHFILLGYLPLHRMRGTTDPAFAAGCGQLFLTRKDQYLKAGTHQAIAESRHDGLKLPRAYRQADLMTDVIDGTELAECRMYHNAPEVIRGVLKNAVEGIANPKLIVPFTIMLIGGAVLPLVVLVWAILQSSWIAAGIAAVAVIVGHGPRAIAAKHFRQPWSGVLFHSLSVLLLVLLQWVALANHLLGRQVAWRGRAES
ncbi:MAG: glycosyltransferase family 2 protein [Rubripirellula sp.]|nr:glycosyltransferase family 2 protein [Rubripirellula sp.]